MKLKRKLGIWRGAEPAPEASIQKLLVDCGFELPMAYLNQLRGSNGGEGDLAIEPGWVSLWPAEGVGELNKDYEIADQILGFFGFGSNGGGELLAFKVKSPEPWTIYMVPFISMEADEARMVAKDFEEFKIAIGYEQTDAE